MITIVLSCAFFAWGCVGIVLHKWAPSRNDELTISPRQVAVWRFLRAAFPGDPQGIGEAITMWKAKKITSRENGPRESLIPPPVDDTLEDTKP